MTERAVRSNQQEAARLYERGVAAARGGQRRMAAVLLSRAVQYDPKHEQAWLWLSGVLDTPEEVAFCLRSVLSLNPHNERARQGIAWLEQRALVNTNTAATPPAERAPVAERPRERELHQERESWWVGWRRSNREMSRARLLVWLVPTLLLVLTLGLNVTLRDAIRRSEERAQAATIMILPQATAVPTVVPVLETTLDASDNARELSYISSLDTQRETLRAAVEEYRQVTSKLGNSAVLHATAARTLRSKVDTAYTVLAELTPPPALERAHVDYLEGLSQERSALDDMLEFYGSFSIQLANRAVLRLQESSQRIERARTFVAQVQQEANTSTRWPVQTAR